MAPPVTWVDTHCHLQLDPRDPAELLRRAPEVAWVIVPGIDADSSRASIHLAKRFPGQVLATAGLHPHEATKWAEQSSEITEMSESVSAIGETGLDYYRDLSPRAAQLESFEHHIDLAIARDLPLIVHCRDAFSDAYEVIERRDVGPRTVLHCWTGGRRWTRRFLELGVAFSFAGPIAFETGETVRLAAELVPPERALIETDTPYLTPPPHRGEPNQPKWVALVGEALAHVWGVTSQEVALVTAENAARTFRK